MGEDDGEKDISKPVLLALPFVVVSSAEIGNGFELSVPPEGAIAIKPMSIKAELLSAVRRILKKTVETERGCWVWLGATSKKKDGYGRISVGGKTRSTHSIVWLCLTGEEIPEGMVLDHKCRVRRCCNPEHLKIIPQVVNTLIGEGPTAQNALKTHCLRGHPFDKENTIVRVRDGRTRRECRACKRSRGRGTRRA